MPSYTGVAKPATTYTGVTAQSVRETGFLLCEDGTYLLQEDGSKILLDFAGGLVRFFKPETTYTNINKPT